jgi:hypothetical protein
MISSFNLNIGSAKNFYHADMFKDENVARLASELVQAVAIARIAAWKKHSVPIENVFPEDTWEWLFVRLENIRRQKNFKTGWVWHKLTDCGTPPSKLTAVVNEYGLSGDYLFTGNDSTAPNLSLLDWAKLEKELTAKQLEEIVPGLAAALKYKEVN